MDGQPPNSASPAIPSIKSLAMKRSEDIGFISFHSSIYSPTWLPNYPPSWLSSALRLVVRRKASLAEWPCYRAPLLYQIRQINCHRTRDWSLGRFLGISPTLVHNQLARSTRPGGRHWLGRGDRKGQVYLLQFSLGTVIRT